MCGRFLAAIALLAVAAGLARRLAYEDQRPPYEPELRLVEPVPIAPWIEPEKDMRTFFAGADRFETEKHPLSALQTELAQKLGRPLESGENLLTVHRIFNASQPVGSVVIRRVKGQHGSIDLAIAISGEQTVRGLRVQRSREPESIEAAISDPQWLETFNGRTANSSWGEPDVQSLPPEARASAKAIIESVKSVLILHAAVNSPASKRHH